MGIERFREQKRTDQEIADELSPLKPEETESSKAPDPFDASIIDALPANVRLIKQEDGTRVFEIWPDTNGSGAMPPDDDGRDSQ